MSEIDYTKLVEVETDWLDQQCAKVYDALDGLSLEQRLEVVEQVLDYLRMEGVDRLRQKMKELEIEYD